MGKRANVAKRALIERGEVLAEYGLPLVIVGLLLPLAEVGLTEAAAIAEVVVVERSMRHGRHGCHRRHLRHHRRLVPQLLLQQR